MKKNKLCLLLRSLFRKPRKKTPIIIWFHNAGADSIEALKTALASEIPNHVMIYARHRECFTWEAMPDVLEAIQIVKDSPAKLIWSRCLWPYWDQSYMELEDFFKPAYYINEIKILREEARRIGADFVALDIEAYGDSIMKLPIGRGDWLWGDQIDIMQSMVDAVIQAVGQVDFIYPAGNARRPNAPWNFLAFLGEKRISEDTYYDLPGRIDSIRYPYEIFGAYLNIVRARENRPDLPYFLVPEIFDRAELWSDKKGLFLYSKEGNALEVAKALLAYSNEAKTRK